LYASLVDETAATQVFTDYGDSFDPNLFNVYAVAKNVNEADLENAIYAEIEK
jgi:hypothetical protein